MSGKIDSSDYSSSLQIGALRLFVPRCVGIHWDDKVKSFALQILDEKWWQKWRRKHHPGLLLKDVVYHFFKPSSLRRYVNELCKCSSAPLRSLNANEVKNNDC